MPLNTIASAELEDEMLELEDEEVELTDAKLEKTAFELSELEPSAPEEALEKALFFPPPPPQADNIKVTHTNFMLTRQTRFKYTVKTPLMRTPQYV
jgi:hypothetical protein